MIGLDDGTPMSGKGRQSVPEGRTVLLAFPGGAGYGNPKDRDVELIKRDVRRGYLTLEKACEDYGLTADQLGE